MKNILSFELFEQELYEAIPQLNPQLKPAEDREKSKNLISGSTHLRKLTKKSKLNFGKWEQLTVENLINNNHTQYLRWVYFNMSNIDFMDDVMEAIGIPAIIRIKKPGTNKELGKSVDKEIQKVFGYKKEIDFETDLNRHKKAQVLSAMKRDEKPSDSDVQRTGFKFGKLEGGRSVREKPKTSY